MRRALRGLLGALLVLGVSAPARAADFFAGKTVTIIVGFAPDGGDDTSPAGTSINASRQRLKPQPTYEQTAQLYAKHLGRFLTGSPRVVTRAMPGAASLAAARFLEKSAAKDGTILAVLGPAFVRQPLLPGGSLQIDPRPFGWIGGRAREIYVCAVRDGVGVNRFEDIRGKQLFFGATDPRSRPFLHAAGLNLALGGQLRLVPGYVDPEEILNSMPRREIDGICGIPLSSLHARYPEWISSGSLKLIAQFGSEKEPRFAYLQTISELARDETEKRVLQLLDDEAVYAWPLVAPPAMPAGRLEELRAAFDAMMRDRQLVSDASAMRLPIDAVSGDELARAVARLADAPPGILGKLRSLSGLD